jgi:hypothetical protein
MLANTKRVYALANFTVELRAKGWYFWRTYGDKSDTKGPSQQADAPGIIALLVGSGQAGNVPLDECPAPRSIYL